MSRFRVTLTVLFAAALLTASSVYAQEGSAKTDTGSSMTTSKLETFAGFYDAGNGNGITVTVEDGKLYGGPTADRKRELLFQSGTTFTVSGTQRPMIVTFVVGTDGRVTEMVMRRGDEERRLPKVR